MQIPHTADRDDLRALYGRHREAHIYALADLDEPHWSRSRWWRRGDAAVGIVDLRDGDDPGTGQSVVYAVSTAEPSGTLNLLVDLAPELPPGTLVTGPLGACDALGSILDVRSLGRHTKYVLAEPELLPDAIIGASGTGPGGLVRLDGRAEHRRLLADLHATDPGAAFVSAAMLTDGYFVGVVEDGALLASAGTHVVSETERVAAIGAVMTHPDARGRGMGRWVTAAVCHLLADRVDVIGLNVRDTNQAAITAYKAIGFHPVWSYEECMVGVTDEAVPPRLHR